MSKIELEGAKIDAGWIQNRVWASLGNPGAQGRPKSAPREARDPPRAAQERPESAPGGPRLAHVRFWAPKRGPKKREKRENHDFYIFFIIKRWFFKGIHRKNQKDENCFRIDSYS